MRGKKGRREKGKKGGGKEGGGKEGGGKGYRAKKQEDLVDLPVLLMGNQCAYSFCYVAILFHGNLLRIVATGGTDDVDTTIIYRRLNSLTRLDIVRGNSLTIDVDDAHICLPLER